ncbi:MAG TPA: putative DNA-binding domain-containing protein [Polyangiaceae bacterium]|nr:putative DNA-binding domain-containing protein [Polyangiaceae bacterium]
MKLAELERFFSEAATSGSGPRAGLEQVFLGDARLSASDRLAIYNRSYYYRLLDALSSVFEQTARVLGRAEIERLALAYLTLHPSEQPAVERVGRLFPSYLRERDELADWVADLAALEWARLSALVAANPRTVLSVSDIDPALFPSSRAHLVPALHWLELDSRALHAFTGAQLRTTPSSAPGERCGVVVWRKQHAVLHEQLPVLELQALQLAAEGRSISRICSCFESGDVTRDTERAFQMLSGWLARHWLESIESSSVTA